MARATYDSRRPRIPVGLAEKIDAERGQVPFNRWVVLALERALGEPHEVLEAARARQVPPTSPAPSSAPARPKISPEKAKMFSTSEALQKVREKHRAQRRNP